MADFDGSNEKLKSLGVRVIGGSADSLENAKKAVEELKLSYDLAYEIDVDTLARVTGAYYEVYEEAHPVYQSEESAASVTKAPKAKERKFLQPVGFLIGPEKIEVACYSSAHIGRLNGKDVYTLVKYLKQEMEKKNKEETSS